MKQDNARKGTRLYGKASFICREKWVIFFFFLAMLCSMWDLRSSTRDGTLQWKHGVLTIGPPGKSQKWIILFAFCCCCLVTKVISDSFVTLWTVARQAPLSMGCSRQEYWSRLPFPTPGDLPNPGIEPASLVSPALTGRFLTTNATLEALKSCKSGLNYDLLKMVTS